MAVAQGVATTAVPRHPARIISVAASDLTPVPSPIGEGAVAKRRRAPTSPLVEDGRRSAKSRGDEIFPIAKTPVQRRAACVARLSHRLARQCDERVVEAFAPQPHRMRLPQGARIVGVVVGPAANLFGWEAQGRGRVLGELVGGGRLRR